MITTKHLTAGETHTLESFWNSSGTAFFKGPAGATINVKYGKGRFSVNRQKQALDGKAYKKLSVGAGSLVYARMRMKVPTTTDVTYEIDTGTDVVATTPKIRF